MSRAGTRSRTAALVGLLALVLALLAPALPAAAHAELESSNPADGATLAAAPAVIELVFNEPVTPVPDAFRLFGSAGELPRPDATATGATVSVRPQGDATGRLLLAYRVISGDGHPVSGTLSFTVGADTGGAPVGPDATVDDPAVGWLTGALTSAQYTGLLLGVGLLAFGAWVARTPVLPRTARAAWLLAVGASAALVPLAALRGAGLGLGDPGWVASVQPGTLIALALVIAAGPAWWLRGPFAPVLSLAALAAPVLVGHTRTATPSWLMLTGDAAHLAAAAFWLGGLVGLVAVAAPGRIPADDAARVVARFSGGALVSVAALAASGVAMAVLVLPAPSTLVDGGYGRTLLLKVGVVVAAVVLAAWNRFALVPTLRRAPVGDAWPRLRRMLAKEAALVVTVAVITGFFTQLDPHDAHHHDPAPVTISADSQGLRVDGEATERGEALDPSFRLDYQGQTVTDGEVVVQARLPEQSLGPIRAEARYEDGRWVASLPLPVGGAWQVQFTARVSRFESHRRRGGRLDPHRRGKCCAVGALRGDGAQSLGSGEEARLAAGLGQPLKRDGELRGARLARGDVVGNQLDEHQGRLPERASRGHEAGEAGLVQFGEAHQQSVPAAQVRILVREHGAELGRGERPLQGGGDQDLRGPARHRDGDGVIGLETDKGEGAAVLARGRDRGEPTQVLAVGVDERVGRPGRNGDDARGDDNGPPSQK